MAKLKMRSFNPSCMIRVNVEKIIVAVVVIILTLAQNLIPQQN